MTFLGCFYLFAFILFLFKAKLTINNKEVFGFKRIPLSSVGALFLTVFIGLPIYGLIALFI